jgi:hypothetical protein
VILHIQIPLERGDDRASAVMSHPTRSDMPL